MDSAADPQPSIMRSPVVLKFANWLWGGSKMSETMNPGLCLEKLPFGLPPMECVTQATAKAVGLGIILLSCMNKAPVILNLWRSQSAAGLARTSLYGDWLVYSNSAMYGLLRGNPITAFGEFLALIVQSTILIGLTWYLSPSVNSTATSSDSVQRTQAAAVSTMEKACLVTFAVTYVYAVTQLLDSSLYFILQSSSLPILLLSRGSQILQTQRIQHTGALSIVTTSMSLSGSLTRVLTTIKEVGWDVAMLAPFVLSCALNSICCLQYLYYYDNTQRFVAELKQQQEEKKNA